MKLSDADKKRLEAYARAYRNHDPSCSNPQRIAVLLAKQLEEAEKRLEWFDNFAYRRVP